MKKLYAVVLQANAVSLHDVEASSEEEAIQIAKNEIEDSGCDPDWVLESVEEQPYE